MKNFFQLSGVISLCFVLAVSCSKNGYDKASEQNGSVSANVVTCVSTGITGNCASPSGGSWGAIDYDLSVPGLGAGQIQFVDRFNASLQVTTGYYAYIYDASGVTACNVTRGTLAASAVATSGNVGFNNNGLGWYNYTLMTPSPVADRVVVVTDASTSAGIAAASEVYVLQLNSIGFTPGSCTPGQFKGLLNFTVNEL